MRAKYFKERARFHQFSLHLPAVFVFMITVYLNIKVILPFALLDGTAVNNTHIVVIPCYRLQRFKQCSRFIMNGKDHYEPLMLWLIAADRTLLFGKNNEPCRIITLFVYLLFKDIKSVDICGFFAGYRSYGLIIKPGDLTGRSCRI